MPDVGSRRKLDNRPLGYLQRKLKRLVSILTKQVRKRWIVKKEIVAISPRERGGMDSAHVKEHYEEHWGKRVEGIRKKLEAGESLAHIMATKRPPPHLVASYNIVSKRIAREVLADHTQTHVKGVPLARMGVTSSLYTVVSNFDPLRAIFRHALAADIIVELGAGPGWNLFNLATFLGQIVNKKVLFGLEFTDAGLEIMRLVAEHEQLPLTAHFFDYINPDLSMLPSTGRMLIFTHHSIEQVEDVSPALHEQIAARRAPTQLIYCEPIGWQRIPELAEARLRGNDAFFKRLISRRLDDLSATDAVVINAAINSWRLKYNRNTYASVQEYIKDGKFKLQEEYFDFTHSTNANPVNPSTYIDVQVVQ